MAIGPINFLRQATPGQRRHSARRRARWMSTPSTPCSTRLCWLTSCADFGMSKATAGLLYSGLSSRRELAECCSAFSRPHRTQAASDAEHFYLFVCSFASGLSTGVVSWHISLHPRLGMGGSGTQERLWSQKHGPMIFAPRRIALVQGSWAIGFCPGGPLVAGVVLRYANWPGSVFCWDSSRRGHRSGFKTVSPNPRCGGATA